MILSKDWNVIFFSYHTALHPNKLFVPYTSIKKVLFYLEFGSISSMDTNLNKLIFFLSLF